MKRGWTSAPKATHKCDLDYLQPENDLKRLVQNENYYVTDLNSEIKRG